MTPAELLAAIDQVRYDLSVTQTRVIEIANAVKALIEANELSAPPVHICPTCSCTQRSKQALAEHRYHIHDGPVPEHYLAAERLAGIEPPPPPEPELPRHPEWSV